MNQAQTVIKRESKNKIRVDFERTSLWKRLRVKYVSVYFLGKVIYWLFRIILLLGISYIILFPFLGKITGSIMSPEDFIDSTVKMIPKAPTLNTYRALIIENHYFDALKNTAILSLLCAFVQMFVCTFVGYGLSKFKFKGRTLVFLAVVLTMAIPHQTLQLGLFMQFRFFDIWGIIGFIEKYILQMKVPVQSIGLWNIMVPRSVINFINTYWPLAIMSITGLAFKNGLYIFVMRQFFKGVPDELEEAAYVDGAGVVRTFFNIILPTSIPMMVTIFLFAFSWQWTDEFYSLLFFTQNGPRLLPSIVAVPNSLMQSQAAIAASVMYQSAINSTAGLMIIAPLIVVYLFGQRFLIQGIERSGIVG